MSPQQRGAIVGPRDAYHGSTAPPKGGPDATASTRSRLIGRSLARVLGRTVKGMTHPTGVEKWRARLVAAAGIWSAAAAAVGLIWATTGTGFPFGVNDPRAVETGSFFPDAQPGPAGVATVAIGIFGVALAVALYRFRGAPLTGLAGTFAVVLLLLVPDIRIIQNFAYLFFGYVGLIDAATGWMLAAILGGVLWAGAAATSAAVRLRCDPSATGAFGPASGVDRPRWGTAVTIAAALLALPYPMVRISWALGVPLGVPPAMIENADPTLRIGEAGLGLLAVGGAVLTLGLIRPWGRAFPRWLPALSGRPVPIWLAVVPGAWAAIIISAAGLRLTVWTIQTPPDPSSWGASGPGLFFLPWGLSVAAATYAYWRRRTTSTAPIPAERTPAEGGS